MTNLPQDFIDYMDRKIAESRLHLVRCPECFGDGKVPGRGPVIAETCKACNGKGRVLMRESEFKVYAE